jgi:DNA replication protein DnaC
MDLLIIDEIGSVPFSEKRGPALLPGGGSEL